MLPGALFGFKDKQAVLDVVQAQTSGNGMYFDTRGVFAVVALRPDLGDKTQEMGKNLVLEFLTNVLEALVLALLLLRARAAGAMASAWFCALAGVAALLATQVSYWNWYGFSVPFTAQSLIDVVVGWFLAGLMLGMLRRKLAPAGN